MQEIMKVCFCDYVEFRITNHVFYWIMTILKLGNKIHKKEV